MGPDIVYRSKFSGLRDFSLFPASLPIFFKTVAVVAGNRPKGLPDYGCEVQTGEFHLMVFETYCTEYSAFDFFVKVP
jgi:hypothetical protein